MKLEGDFLRNIVRLGFHLLPLVAFYYNKKFLIIAAVLFVFVPYIKVKKISLQIERIDDAGNRVSYEKALSFWQYLTFM